ncbi:MAG: methyltransferase [Alphaproteobacteria bacterium]
MDIKQIVAERIAQITERVMPADTDRDVAFLNFGLHVKAGVFDPSRGRSARKMAEAIDLAPPRPNDRVLEMGAGAGGLTIHMAKNHGATDITALDIMPQAVACARENFARHGLDHVRLNVSDLFAAVREEIFVPGGGKYDYIVFNAPTAHPAALASLKGAVTLWDHTGSVKSRFIEQAKAYSSPDARILMMYSKYADYDSLANLDLRGFEQRRLLVSRDDISEAGVLLLRKLPVAAP